MKLLLDTHALLWWLGDDARLGQQARALLADQGNDVWVSAASLWEMAVKIRIRQLDADIPEIVGAIEQLGFSLLGVEAAHLETLAGLPFHPEHRDPFDHLLIAQAITEGSTFLSEDRNAFRYPVSLLSCSDRTG